MSRTFTQERKPEKSARKNRTVKVDREALELLAYVRKGLSLGDAREAVKLAHVLKDERKAERKAYVASLPIVESELASTLASAWAELAEPRMEAAQSMGIAFPLAIAWASASREYRKTGTMRMKAETLEGLRSLLGK
jgi:hypothetical protein